MLIYDTPYWYWQATLSPELCDLLIAEGDKLVAGDGKTGGVNAEGSYDPRVRETNISFFEPGHWIEGICMHYANIANRGANWNMEFFGPQPVQYARYFPGQHYTPHRDDSIKVNNDPMRKLSVSIQLSDPSAYTNGDFVIEDATPGQYRPVLEFRPRGSVIVFPSLIEHAVTPVLSGVRHSIVCWVVGPKFR